APGIDRRGRMREVGGRGGSGWATGEACRRTARLERALARFEDTQHRDAVLAIGARANTLVHAPEEMPALLGERFGIPDGDDFGFSLHGDRRPLDPVDAVRI